MQVSDDAQKRLTVAAGTESGNPAASAAQRAMSPIPSCATFTHPAAMSSIRSSSTPTRSHAQAIVWPSRSSVRICESEPRSGPRGSARPRARKRKSSRDSPRSEFDYGACAHVAVDNSTCPGDGLQSRNTIVSKAVGDRPAEPLAASCAWSGERFAGEPPDRQLRPVPWRLVQIVPPP